MKKWLVFAGILLSLVMIGPAACQSGKTSTSQQPVQVTTGNLTITVSGSGAVEMVKENDLNFGIGGRIATISVKEGDTVGQGQVIAKLETDSLQLALSQANVAYAQAQLAAQQNDLAVSQAGVSLTQAGIAVKSAQIALDQTISSSTVNDIRVAQAQLDTAKNNLSDSLIRLAAYTVNSTGYNEYQKNVVLAQARVQAAQDQLDALLNGTSTDEVSVKQQQVVAAQQAQATAQQSLDLANLSANVSQQSVSLAAFSRELAQKQLDKATITALYAGVITAVPVHVGDTVGAPSIIAHIVVPDLMELKVQVDEIDIPSVQLGQRAIVKVDALPDTPLNGKVSYINPTPGKSTGVTLFDVTISLDSTSGVGLRNGMSATSDIVTMEHDNVLMVPDRVIKQNSQGGNIVNVIVNGQTQVRPVVIGISDGINTEIISGLKTGETVSQ